MSFFEKLFQKYRDKYPVNCPGVIMCANNGVVAVARCDDFDKEIRYQRKNRRHRINLDLNGIKIPTILLPDLLYRIPVFRFSNKKIGEKTDFRSGTIEDLEKILDKVWVESRTFNVRELSLFMEGSRISESRRGVYESKMPTWELDKVREYLCEIR